MRNIDLSIIIVNFNTKDYIKNCLNSIIENINSLSFETIVIDNNSHDGSVNMLRREFPQVRLIANTENVGFGRANNQGVRISKGRYILLLNSDTKVLPRSIETLHQFMETHPDVAIAAPKLLNSDLSLQHSCRNFPGLWHDVIKGFGFHKYLPNHPILGSVRISGWNHDKLQEVDQPQGACLMVRRDVLNQGNIFDPQFFMYYEEVDLCYRVKKNNWLTYYIPDAKIIHYSGKSFSKNMPRMIYYMYKSKFLFYKKHYNLIKQSVLFLFTIFEMVYRINIYGLIGLVFPRRRKEARLRLKGYYHVFSHFVQGKLLNL